MEEEKIIIDDRFVVSEETAKWVYLYKELNDFADKIHHAIIEDYGIENVDKIMAKEFDKPFIKIADALQDHFKRSAFDCNHLASIRDLPLVI